ncbi:MAG: hydrolase [Proteobacteria bacterium]|nr:hydrolase [Pseudomonadota bacterium]
MVNRSGKRQNLITREESVLAIIDVQDKLIPVIAHKEIVIENIVRLTKFAQMIGLPILITEQVKLGPTVHEVKKESQDSQPITKVHFNCFFSNEFKNRVHKTGRKTLILAGIEAHICVAQTALYALPYFNVHVVSDAISSRTLKNWNVAMERMRQAGIIITSTEMLIYELLQQAGTDEFKSALLLVK